MCNIRRVYCLRELYDIDFHKRRIHGSGRVWANARDVFRRAPSRGGRGRRAALDFVVCFGWGDFFRGFIFIFDFIFFLERARPTASKCEVAFPHLLIYYYRGAYRVPLFN